MRLAPLALAAILVPSIGQAEPIASRSFQMSAFVPVVCRVTHVDVASEGTDGVIALGALERLCNDRGGYRLLLVHSPDLAGSVFEIGGVKTVIGPGSETVVFAAHAPQLRTDLATIRLAPGRDRPAMLAFRMEPANSI